MPAINGVVFIIHSCRKDQHNTTLSTTLNSSDINELQGIYSKGISAGNGLAGNSINGTAKFNLIRNLNVKWDKYVINNRVDNSQVVEFDMQPDTGTIVLKKINFGDPLYYHNKTCAVFIKFNNGTRLNFFMKIIEDFSQTHKSVINDIHYKQVPAAFTGQVVYYTLDKKFINGYRYQNGKIIGSLSAGFTKTAQQLNATQQLASVKQTLKVAPVTCLDDDYYYWECTNGITPDTDTEEDCSYWYAYSITYCSGGGDDGGGVTGDPGSGGGGGGGGTTPLFLPAFDNKLPPCAGTIINAISSLNIPQVTMCGMFADGEVTDSYGVSDMLNLVMNNYGIQFTAGTKYPCCNATTSPTELYPATTELETPYLNKASSLSVARTIVHESIHAYFQYGLKNLKNDPNFANFQSIYSVLFDTNGNPQNDQNLAQHNQMANDYVSGIADVLYQYAYNAGITSPDSNRSLYDYCKDMAWGGLAGTNAYQSLSTTDQTRINNTLYNEQEGNSSATTKKACP